jgi:hypothetical protein
MLPNHILNNIRAYLGHRMHTTRPDWRTCKFAEATIIRYYMQVLEYDHFEQEFYDF